MHLFKIGNIVLLACGRHKQQVSQVHSMSGNQIEHDLLRTLSPMSTSLTVELFLVEAMILILRMLAGLLTEKQSL